MGRWVEEAGFTIGSKVNIEVSPGRLVIEALPSFLWNESPVHRLVLGGGSSSQIAEPLPIASRPRLPHILEREDGSELLLHASWRRVMKPLHQVIRLDVEAALGTVVSQECVRSRVDLRQVAACGNTNLNAVKSLARGARQPGLAEFITLAWSLHEEPASCLTSS